MRYIFVFLLALALVGCSSNSETSTYTDFMDKQTMLISEQTREVIDTVNQYNDGSITEYELESTIITHLSRIRTHIKTIKDYNASLIPKDRIYQHATLTVKLDTVEDQLQALEHDLKRDKSTFLNRYLDFLNANEEMVVAWVNVTTKD